MEDRRLQTGDGTSRGHPGPSSGQVPATANVSTSTSHLPEQEACEVKAINHTQQTRVGGDT